MKTTQLQNPTASLVIAVRNEARTVGEVLRSVQKQSFTDFELIVSDGQSDDSTTAVLSDFCQADPRIHWMVNDQRYTSHGLNMGINAARGSIIVILSGHAMPAPDFLRESVAVLDQTAADCVGGIVIPGGQSFLQRCFSKILSSWFGTGGARFRYSARPGYVDTVAYGAYRRAVFQRLGGFREDLIRNMDIEFNSRLKKEGGKIYFSPKIRTSYQVRSSLKAFLGQAFANGAWNIKTTYLVPHSLTWRHFIPFGFTSALLLSIPFAALFPWGWVLLVAILLPYGILDLWFSVRGATLERRPAFALVLPLIYFLFHLFYGLGSLFSLLTYPWWRRTLQKKPFR